MPTKGTSVKGIRLTDQEWAAVDAEAQELGMSRNEYVARRLRTAISRGLEVRKTDDNVCENDTLEVA